MTLYDTRLVCREEAGPDVQLRNATDAVKAVQDLRHMDREAFCVLFLDTRHRIRGKQIVSVGSLNASLAEPREVFKGAILASVQSIITVHNHPSDDVHPSGDDERLWDRLTKAGTLLGKGEQVAVMRRRGGRLRVVCLKCCEQMRGADSERQISLC